MIDRVFEDIAARLAGGRRYLVGDRFTAADLTLAALAAPALLPAGYGVRLPEPSGTSPAMNGYIQINLIINEHGTQLGLGLEWNYY